VERIRERMSGREEIRERRLTTGDTCRKAMLGDVTKTCYLRFSVWYTHLEDLYPSPPLEL